MQKFCLLQKAKFAAKSLQSQRFKTSNQIEKSRLQMQSLARKAKRIYTLLRKLEPEPHF